MAGSFKFPQESPAHKSVPLSLAQRQGTLNVAVRPFPLPGLGGIDIGAIKKVVLQAKSPVSDGNCDGNGDDDVDGGNDVDDEHELPIPLSMKACRAPIPLDFKHPVSTNTVPVGLFKALANDNGSSNGHSNNASITGEGEEPRTRRAVRSNFSSREIFEYPSRPSLDDLRVPAIFSKASRDRLITDPGWWDVLSSLCRSCFRQCVTAALPPRDEQRPLFVLGHIRPPAGHLTRARAASSGA